jgi:hypothetical protein
MNKYLVTLRLRGQLVKTALYAESAIHARLICEYQFGIGCINSAPTKISNEVSIFPLLDDIAAGSPPSIKPQAPKPPKPKTITPTKPPTPDQMRIKQLQANVDRQRDALQRERESQKRRREAEQRRRELSGF